MFTVVIGLVAALIFGSADFLGGLAAKRISPLRVTAVTAAAGLVLLLAVAPSVGGSWSAGAILWGGLSGISGALAISLLYACLAIGPMSILSPLTAVVSAVVPMTWGLIGGDRFAPIGYVALGLALVAVVLVGFVPERGAVRPRPRGIAMAIGSGLMIGVFMILIDATPHDSGLVPLIMNRAVNAAIMFATVGLLALWQQARRRARSSTAVASAAVSSTRGSGMGAGNSTGDGDATVTRTGGWRPGLVLAVTGGLVDATANILMLVGLRIGDLSVIAVLTAMYPAGTIILAAVVLRERIAPVQWVGLVLAIGAAGLLALA
ncbi:MAG: EamA/RhaT family transporter [Microbacteriaceae bacterium]|nr:MAG: EamA/RhaT family transporter [Microbacteriaceae bacterium]